LFFVSGIADKALDSRYNISTVSRTEYFTCKHAAIKYHHSINTDYLVNIFLNVSEFPVH